jgi:hypothetical protein
VSLHVRGGSPSALVQQQQSWVVLFCVHPVRDGIPSLFAHLGVELHLVIALEVGDRELLVVSIGGLDRRPNVSGVASWHRAGVEVKHGLISMFLMPVT